MSPSGILGRTRVGQEVLCGVISYIFTDADASDMYEALRMLIVKVLCPIDDKLLLASKPI